MFHARRGGTRSLPPGVISLHGFPPTPGPHCALFVCLTFFNYPHLVVSRSATNQLILVVLASSTSSTGLRCVLAVPHVLHANSMTINV